jgi:hypothetical protein
MKKIFSPLLAFSFFLTLSSFLFFVPQLARAALNSDPLLFNAEVSIPGSNYIHGKPVVIEASTKPIIDYVNAVYNYIIGIVGIIAAVMVMVGGLIWVASAGDSGKIGEAKEYITAGLSGMVLILGSYLLLRTINPALVDIKTREIDTIKKIATLSCCGGKEGLVSVPYTTDENGKDVFASGPKKGQPVTCEAGAPCKPNEQCIGTESDDSANYSCVEVRPCHDGDTQGMCACDAFDGSNDIDDDDKNCVGMCEGNGDGECYETVNKKGGKCGGGGAGRCIYEKGDNDCNSKDWGENCGENLWCCKITNAKQVNATCADESQNGKGCLINGQSGFCSSVNVCTPCAKYRATCTNDDQCPDQDFNDQTNLPQQCGWDLNGNDNGDCVCGWFGMGNSCTCEANDD